MTTALEGGEGSASRLGRSLPPGKTRYPLYRRLGGTQGRSGQVQKISPPTGIRFPDRPARSQSLYRLSYPAHCVVERFQYFGRTKRKLVLFLETLVATRIQDVIFTLCSRRHEHSGSCIFWIIQNDTKKRGNFWKIQQKLKKSKKKIYWQKLNHYNLPFKRQ